MQYYVKIYNTSTNQLIGYYKEKGLGNISKMKKGIKLWDTYQEAYEIAKDLDNSFVRDGDGHYYTCLAVVYGEFKLNSRMPTTNKIQSEEERGNEVNAFIRQNRSRITERTRD